MKIHIFALRWKDEIRRSSQLRTLPRKGIRSAVKEQVERFGSELVKVGGELVLFQGAKPQWGETFRYRGKW